MRHIFHSAMLWTLIAGAVSCNPSEMPQSSDTMELRPTAIGVTKSVAEEGSLPTTYILTASAHLDGQVEKFDYFKAHRFIHEGGVWKGSPSVYWPVSGKLSMLCMATEESGADLADLCRWGSPNAITTVQADIPDGINLDSEILYGASDIARSSNGLHMHHTQACLRFLMESNASGLIRIDRIELEDVYSGGVVTVHNEGLLSHDWKFTGHHRHELLTVPGCSDMVIGEDISQTNILLPEQRSGNIRISYRRRNYISDTWDDAPVVKTVVHAPCTDEWQSSSIYEYHLQIKLTEIILSLSIEDWGHSSTSVSTLH